MDYESTRETESELGPGNLAPEIAAAAVAGARAGATPLLPGPDNTVVLPDGASLDDIRVQGRDLVITLEDGRIFVIPDGAVYVPQIVAQGVAVPPLNLAALLVGTEPEPAAGPVRSSGGNFAVPVDPLQAAYKIGSLLPYTELNFPEPERRELFPDRVNRTPDVEIEDGSPPSKNAVDEVSETGLPGDRDGNVDPESPGSAAGNNAHITDGRILIESPDGIASVTINGITITGVAGQVIDTPRGTLVLGALADGQIPYVYTLKDNTSGDSTTDLFTVIVTDPDGDSSTATLTINIIDDVPTARNDVDDVPAQNYAPQTGNVTTGAGTTTGAAGADTAGADGATVTGFHAGSGTAAFTASGNEIDGQYGTLTLNADGSYTYTRATNTPGGVSDVFTYQVTDGDGDTSTATLTIRIADSETKITFVPEIGEGTQVLESHLPPRGSEPEGSQYDGDGDVTSSTITFTSPDGVSSVTIGGTTLTPGNLPQTVVSNSTGTLVITGYTYDATTGQGSISYTYTLLDNTLNTDGSIVSFPIVVTDLDNDSDSDTLDIQIIDDAPTARDDSAEQGSENAPITVDVMDNDTTGADGVNLSNKVELVTDSLTGAGSLAYNGDGTFTYTPAAGEEGTVTFQYRITDGDGDPSIATVTIKLIPDSIPEVEVSGENTVYEAGLPARGDEPEGSDATANSEQTSGTLSITTGNDTLAKLEINGQDVTNGGTVTGAHGTLVVTLAAGTYSYVYTLTDNTSGDATTDDFTVLVTDSDGDTDDTAFSIAIVDDQPTANADIDSVTEDGPTTANGNVLAGGPGADANSTDGVADTQGADGATVTAISFGETEGTVGQGLVGAYGTLTLNSDGSYSYVLNNSLAAVQGLDSDDTLTEVFTYQITDGDGDPSSTTLTITINGSDDPITINGLNVDAPELIVDEDDLTDGSSPNADALTQIGSFTVNGLDGISEIKVGGANAVVGQTFTTAHGIFTITGVSGPVDGSQTAITISYSYELTDNLAHATGNGQNYIDEVFTVAVKDTDGSVDTDTIEVRIIDDVPTAVSDTDTIEAGEFGPATGNVITDNSAGDFNDGDSGKDTLGADGAQVNFVGQWIDGQFVQGTGHLVGAGDTDIQGQYGTLTIHQDGSYSYTRDAGTPGGVIDQFVYGLSDGDGDPAYALLSISIGDAPPELDVPPAGGATTTVYEAGLPARPGESEGSDAGSGSNVVSGTITVHSPDGADSVSVNGVDIDVDQFPQTVLSNATGTLVITGAAFDPVTGNGYLNYTYTLLDNTSGDNTSVSVPIVFLDADGDPANGTLTIAIVDDKPVAYDDTDSVPGGTLGPAVGNVITDAEADGGKDTQGADSVTVTAISGSGGDGTVGGTTSGTYGTLTLNADGSYSYTRNAGTPGNVSDVFTYEITDSDGDKSTATLTILIEDNAPFTTPNATVLLDDDTLGGNAGGTDDRSPDTDHLTGTLSGSGGDGALAWNFETTGNPSGFTYSLNGSTLEVFQGATKVITVTLDTATGAYAVTQNAPIVHETAQAENNQLFTITYTVKDADGDPATGTLTIDVDDDSPLAANDSNSVKEDGPLTATGSVLTGPGADSIGADGPATGGAVTAVKFGAVTGTVGSALPGAHGSLTLNADGTYTYNLTNTDPAVQALDDGETLTEVFTYTITDKDGDPATATLTITINGNNDAPVAVADTNWTIEDAAAPITGNVLQTLAHPGAPAGSFSDQADTDVDVEPLSVGNPGVYVGTYGTLTLNTNGTYSYALNNANPAVQALDTGETVTDTFNYTASDGTTSTPSTLTVTIFGNNDAPVAVADTNWTIEDAAAPITGNVLQTLAHPGAPVGSFSDQADTDVDVEPLNVTTTGSFNGTYGVLTLNADGSYSYRLYTQAENAAAYAAVQARDVGDPALTDSFNYTASDGTASASSTLTISIFGANDAPVAVADTNWTIEDAASAITGNVLQTLAHPGAPAGSFSDQADTDVDVEPLNVTTTGSFNGTYGVLTLNGDGSYSYRLYTQAENATAYAAVQARDVGDPALTDSFNYTASDGTATASSTLTISVFGVNDPPVANPDTNWVLDVTSGPDPVSSGNVLQSLAHPGDPSAILSFADQADTDVDVENLTVTSTGTFIGTYGTLVLNTNGSYTYTLNSNNAAVNALDDGETLSESFNYTVTDGTATAGSTLTITVFGTNDAPVAVDDTNWVIEDGANATGNVLNTVPHGGAPAGSFSDQADTDVDGETLTVLAYSQTGTYGTLTLNANGSYTYVLDNTNPAVQGLDTGETLSESFPYLVSDGSAQDAGQLTITIFGSNDAPVVGTATTAVSDEGLAFGNQDSVGNPTDTTNLTVRTGTISITDVDGEAQTVTLGTPTGALSADGVAIVWSGAGTANLTGTAGAGGPTVVTISITNGGAYTVTLLAPIDQLSGNGENISTIVVPVTSSDGNATGSGSLTVNFEDDSPTAVAAGTSAGTVNEDSLGNGNAGGTGDATGTTAVATGSVTGLFLSGADRPLTYTLSNDTSGLPSLTSGGVSVVYSVVNNVLTASAGGNTVFTMSLNASSGDWTFTLVRPIDHALGGNENDQTLQFGPMISATDADGDSVPATGTLTITIDDDTPTATTSGTENSITVDETNLLNNASASFASAFTIRYGADGAAVSNSLAYALAIKSVGANSGLTDTQTGQAVLLYMNGTTVEGRTAVSNQVVFTVTVDGNGLVTLDQVRAVIHADAGDPNDSRSLSADDLITLSATATDRDGDSSVPATINIGQNLNFLDDGPRITAATTPLAIVNSGTVSNTGQFVVNPGGDGAPSNNDLIKSVTFAATVNGTAVGSPTLVAGAENNLTASYSFSFTYTTGTNATATANGTLVFDKVAGTYTVDLDNPIQGFSISQTASGTLFQGYELGTSTPDNTQPAVAVTQVNPNLFIQYTGIDGTATSGSTAPGAWSAGEFFGATASWVSVSNSANGVAGDTIGGDEILNFNLYGSNPTGTVGTPTASADAMFLKFDGIGSSEDFIVILKLYDPSTNTYTSKALMVQNSDIQKGPGTGPGIYSGITLDNNDGLVVFEKNDYNTGSENWVIVGAQIIVDPGTITGTAINFNNTIADPANGISGASTGTQAFSTDVNNGAPMKISSIGLITQTTTSQSAQLTFNVTVQDGDGDTAQQTLVVNVGGTPPVVLDLNGDGVHYLSTDAGVAYDYNGDGTKEATAWVDANDGLLAIDANHNGTVDSASEFVFGGDGLSDLQGVAAKYDSNGDGVLDAQDSAFAQFGVWQDANSDGVSDAGEFHTLTELGITSINLTSDGQVTSEAGGDVTVLGQGSYTLADGSTGLLADAVFATEDQTMDSLLSVGGSSAGGDAQSTQDFPVLADVLADTVDAHAVDSIVEHFAQGSAGAMDAVPNLDHFALQGLLEAAVGGTGDEAGAMRFSEMQALDHEQAAALA